jgi:lipopolysaccharide/colanic/teichoic acid biosynthesis glycosyltransferase
MLLEIRIKFLNQLKLYLGHLLSADRYSENMSQQDVFIKLSVKVFGYLLWLFPKHFRNRRGKEMIQVFGDSCKDTLNDTGQMGLLVLWFRTFHDLLKTALQEQVEHKYHQLFVVFYQRRGKRLFDLVVVIPTTLLLMPVLLIITVLIKLDSHGPVLERQVRLGQYGKPFEMYRFRTSRILKVPGSKDLTFTRVGQFLRRTSLDELPQLINVLSGSMSIVGPLPSRANIHVDCPQSLQKLLNFQKNLPLLPGMTGFWQLEFRDNVSDWILEKLKLDAHYVKNASLWTDMIILLKTPLIVVSYEIKKRWKTQNKFDK